MTDERTRIMPHLYEDEDPTVHATISPDPVAATAGTDPQPTDPPDPDGDDLPDDIDLDPDAVGTDYTPGPPEEDDVQDDMDDDVEDAPDA